MGKPVWLKVYNWTYLPLRSVHNVGTYISVTPPMCVADDNLTNLRFAPFFTSPVVMVSKTRKESE